MFRSVHDSKENVEPKTVSVVYFNLTDRLVNMR